MSDEKKYVVTIARQFGSLGRPIAKMMSEKLGIEYYDRDIVEQAAKKLNLPVSHIDELEEKVKKTSKNSYMRMMFPLGTESSSEQDNIFEAQQNIMRFLVERESCIIVGRCSDFVLSDEPAAIHIYIYAPYDARVKNCVKDLNLTEEDATLKKMQCTECHRVITLRFCSNCGHQFKEEEIDAHMEIPGVNVFLRSV